MPKPGRHFNTAGPCRADIHYMLPPCDRLEHLPELIDQQAYVVVHAPRQTGNTTPQVQAIIEPILAGQELGDVPNDDVEFLLNIGLCRIDETGNLAIANPIYREVLPRTLAF